MTKYSCILGNRWMEPMEYYTLVSDSFDSQSFIKTEDLIKEKFEWVFIRIMELDHFKRQRYEDELNKKALGMGWCGELGVR